MALAPYSNSSVEQEHDVATTIIAIDRDKNSQYAVKWAVDNLLYKKSSYCNLVHVQSTVSRTQDPNPEQEGRAPTEQELHQFFLPFRGFCARKGIETKEIVLHDKDIAQSLTDYVVSNSIANIVVGASSRNSITRKFRDADVPSRLLKSVPESCSVFVISSKGRIQNLRTSSRPQTPCASPGAPRHACTPKHRYYRGPVPSVSPDSPRSEDMSQLSIGTESWRSELSEPNSSERSIDLMQTMPHEKSRLIYKSMSPVRTSLSSQTSDVLSRNSVSDFSDISPPLSYQSTDVSSDHLGFSILSAGSSGSSSSSHSSYHQTVDEEMRKLKMELKQSVEFYHSVCKEAVLAKQLANELHELKTEKAKIAQETALTLAEIEKQKTRAAVEAAQMAQQLAEKEARKGVTAEMRAPHEAEERHKLMDALLQNNGVCRNYNINEIELATDHFASSHKIGEGGCGLVYIGVIDHTLVAIKVLRPDIPQGRRQFQREVEVLSKMRHPHMVMLLGSCPEYGCLVYEYMENGSLEDRLLRKDNTPPIPWRNRFKIASEIATALLFLHEMKPEPMVHRDLKPANILLDRHYVSKIADVGLTRFLPSMVGNETQYRITAAVGTFCYIDPEYIQTGMLTVKSDLYSLGVMLLQLITAKRPVGLSLQVEKAIEKGTFLDVLDPAVTDWPVEEALSLAKMALKCCELRKKDRPDLGSEVLPELNRLRDFANADSAPDELLPLPRLHRSYPEAETQINVRSGRQQKLKSLTKFFSFRLSPRTSSSISSGSSRRLPTRPGDKALRKQNTGEFLGSASSLSRSASVNYS